MSIKFPGSPSESDGGKHAYDRQWDGPNGICWAKVGGDQPRGGPLWIFMNH